MISHDDKIVEIKDNKVIEINEDEINEFEDVEEPADIKIVKKT
jgi:hypothetical protein